MTLSLFGVVMDRRTRWRNCIAVICFALISCNETATDPRGSIAPQFGKESDPAQSAQAALNFAEVARFTGGQAANERMAQARIGPEGGSLRVGDFEVVVPAGAVAQPTNFRIRIPSNLSAGEPVYAEFLPHGTFEVPVTIRVPRSGTDASDTPGVGWWSGDSWVALPSVGTADGRLETQVGHFSYYSCMRKGIIMGGG